MMVLATVMPLPAVLNLPFVTISYFLWGSPWWFEVAPRLMGALGR